MAAKKSFSQNISTEAINPFFSQQEEPEEESSAVFEHLDPFADLKEDAQEQGRHIPFRPIIPTPAVFAEAPEFAEKPKAQKPMKEIRNRRVQLVLKPSDYDALEKIAHIKRKSTNGILNDLVTDLIEREQASIDTYDQLYRDM